MARLSGAGSARGQGQSWHLGHWLGHHGVGVYRHLQMQLAVLAQGCPVGLLHAKVSWTNTAVMQVQLPQFRKAGLEVIAVFSRGQQRARQIAEQASAPQHVALLIHPPLEVFSAKHAFTQNGIKHSFSSAEDLCLCEDGTPLLVARSAASSVVSCVTQCILFLLQWMLSVS